MSTGQTYAQFRDNLFQDNVRENDLFAGDPAMVPELDWQSRWFSGEFGRLFTGLDGERVEVLQFGWWNRSAGPDFIECAVRIDGQDHTGAIELDIDARDWEKHGHATNPNYEQVVLHLFFRGPATRFFCRSAGHRKIVQVALPVLGGGSGRREAALRLGRCAIPFATAPLAAVERFLRLAAHHRAESKARKFLRVANVHGTEEAWYQAIAEALGYFANRDAMRILAQRVPLKLLRASPVEAEALLFGHAGFLDARPFDDETATAARAYLRRLWDNWWKHRADRVRQPRWDFAAQRPANHPHRRVAVLALIANQWKQLRECIDSGSDMVGELVRQFEALHHPFWSQHFTLASDLLPEPVALAGKERVIDFAGNTLLPVRALGNPTLWDLYDALPGGQTSRSVMRAAERLLGMRPDGKLLLRRFAMQQGLLQVYRDFCLDDTSECHSCPFPEQLRDGLRL